ncbi:hypothetical protein SERLA73DRAFT_74765 [Serpula lacrymans var. lacrymans S7.3]|uniref:T6SS Phospholipase effector Tle1-like catalytic domain-containing protein n=2 Tax=Serpula lacrymans var. lacrymans TaxID=341189 RepID=F8Q0C0_SERL3|nr:uncharacterized protein SERLADRAFT_439440 [Serpula lacrymans var. lacrymans S7.9]EGN98570.1 hypothetical protein SERLA73DRAFT_74765 [Serpula lacrymans var. lacrymans S7.3]EGO24135.1 hypothetical protein SERLADRAFT_439440 [Serpula lacrymans var. lacrymans S7.9]
MAPKRLLIFCDGTGMDGNLSESKSMAQAKADDANTLLDEKEPGAPRGGSSDPQNASNVLRLSRAVKLYSSEHKQQIVFYQSGVGSEAGFDGDPVIESKITQATGIAVASKIRDAYAFIAQNFEVEDEIYIFGFSRGAYAARKLAGLIDRIGLLETKQLGHFFTIWRQLVDHKDPIIPPGTRTTRIRCVGVWDTVGSVLNEINALNIEDGSLPASIDVALHAVSMQENRQKFLPTLWKVPKAGLRPGQILKEVWFPGAHSDVGGGYKPHELADIAVFWMAGEIQSFVDLDLPFLQSSKQQDPEPWGKSQPHNAYEETPWGEQFVIGHETRLESQQLAKDSKYHQSIQYGPNNLVKPKYMVTLDELKKAFGPDFQPDYPALNDFEQKAKNEWSRKARMPDGSPPNDQQPVFENPGDLFG